jgi:hypothetical protein
MWRCTRLFSRRFSLRVASSATRRRPVRLFEALVKRYRYGADTNNVILELLVCLHEYLRLAFCPAVTLTFV